MKKLLLALTVLALVAIASPAFASGNELAYKRVGELDTLLAASIASGDLIPIWDASTNQVKSVDATAFPYGGGTITVDDGVTDSPSLIFKDGTDETATFLKLDAAYLKLTTDATDGLNILVGNLKIGNGVPDATINGEDLYVEGISEFDGAARFDGTVALAGAVTSTSTGSFTSLATSLGIVHTLAPTADHGTTKNGSKVAYTVPIHTTGTNVDNAYDIALTIGNASGGTNTTNGIKIENVTGDAQVNVTGLNIGTGTTLGTSNAIAVGSGWDAGLVLDSNLQVNSTNGTAISAIRFASDTIASGQTAKTVTVTGATASSKCVAQANEIPSNTAYIKSAAPGTDQVVVTVNTDPGASNLDITVLCMN